MRLPCVDDDRINTLLLALHAQPGLAHPPAPLARVLQDLAALDGRK